jgi:hypothetical protein
LRRKQVERSATTPAISIKYRSQEGLNPPPPLIAAQRALNKLHY